MNPIEDEAVVASILQKYGDKVKLLEVELPGFKFQKGLTDWKFMIFKKKADLDRIDTAKKENTEGQDESYFNEYEKFEDVPEELIRYESKSLNKIIRESMFATHYSQEVRSELSKCLRVMPHHQNTSGFFITII